MALTKVQTIGIETGISLTGVTTVTTLNASTDTLSVGGTVNFGGNVSIAGTLTYEDVTNIDAVGLITARSGISITGGDLTLPDAIIHDGDTNTKVRFPGNDTFTVETSGSEALRIDGSQRLLMGRTSTAAAAGRNSNIQLHSNDASEASITIRRFYVNTDDNAPPRLVLARSGSNSDDFTIVADNNRLGEITFAGADGTDARTEAANIRAEVDGTPGSNDMPGRLIFSTTADGASDYTERLRITSAGDMGLGATPAFSNGSGFEVARSGTACIRIEGNSGNHALESYADSNGATLDARGSSANLMFDIGGSEKLRIDSSGRLLQGLTSAKAGFFNDNNAAPVHQIQGSTYYTTAFSIFRDGSGASGPNFILAKGREAIVQNDDDLGTISFQGHDGTTELVEGAAIRGEVDGTPGSNDMPGRLVFFTTADGASTSTERMRITQEGKVNANNWSFNGQGTTTAANCYLGTFAPGSSAMAFATGGNERARIDSSGRLLVGTTSNFVRGNIQAVDSGGGEITIGRNDTTVASGNDIGHLFFCSNDANTSAVASANISCIADADHTGDSAPTRLIFSTTAASSTTPTERVRITSDGYFNASNTGSISTSNYHSITSNVNTYRSLAVVNSSNASGDGTYYSYVGTNANNTSSYHFVGATQGVDKILIYGNGNIVNVNNSYGSLSDVKLKENIVDASSQWDDIKDIRVRKYNFIEGQTHTQIGVVAQEIETVSPGLVTESPDRDEDGNDLGTVTKSVNYSVLYMKAIKALQEAQTRIESLEARLDAGGL